MTIDDNDKNGHVMTKLVKYISPRKLFLGFFLGVIVSALLLLGYNLVMKSNNETPTTALSLTEFDEPDIEVVTVQNFEKEVINSDKPVLLFIINPNDSNEIHSYINRLLGAPTLPYNLKIRMIYLESNEEELLELAAAYHIVTSPLPMAALFNNGMTKGARSLLLSSEEVSDWMKLIDRTIIHIDDPTPTPPEPDPVFFLALPKTGLDRVGRPYKYIISELTVFPFMYAPPGFIRSEANKKLLVNEYINLYRSIGTTYGGDSEWFNLPDLPAMLPDLSSQLPDPDYYYFIYHEGYMDYYDSYGSKAIEVNDIKYYGVSEIDYRYTSEIILAKNINESDFGHLILPCDGREIQIIDNFPLYSLLGSQFGGDGIKTMALPDLSNVPSPIEGAQYYIIVNGEYPHRQ